MKIELDEDEAEILYYSLNRDDVPESSKTGIVWAEVRNQIDGQIELDDD